MLNLKKLLTKIMTELTVPNKLNAATLASGVTGWVSYVKVGRTVTMNGVISITSAKSAGATLATGLPIPMGAWTIGNITPFTIDTALRVGSDGSLVTAAALASGTNNIRFAWSYLANS